ncbi:MAG: response regulator [Deltaproteobacteria bacterium]|nr:response regulator [Deltaproteobacteria bacterium]
MIRILIIDDSFMVRTALKRLLEAVPGFEIVGEAKNGMEGIEKVKVFSPHVVTCDMEMPVMDGVQVMMHLRTAHPKVKVVVLSSITQPDSPKERICQSLGAFAVMAKPVQHSDLDPVQDAEKLIHTIQQAASAA